MRDENTLTENGVPDEMRMEISLLDEKYRGFPLKVEAFRKEYEEICRRYGANPNVIYHGL